MQPKRHGSVGGKAFSHDLGNEYGTLNEMDIVWIRAEGISGLPLIRARIKSELEGIIVSSTYQLSLPGQQVLPRLGFASGM